MNGVPGPDAAKRKNLSIGALFSGFFQAGILGFGGVLPVARRMIVEQRQWMDAAAFNDLFSLCQFLPGANVVNFAFAFGARNRGLAGAAAAVAGLLSAPLLIVLCISALYQRFGAIPIVQHGLGGLAAAASGLVLGTAMKIAAPVCRGLLILGHVSLPLTMLLVLPLSIALAWRPLAWRPPARRK
jgi:chromate transporter